MNKERELLKMAYAAFLNIAEEPSNADEVCTIMGKIKAELEKPLPEPVCWWDGLNDTTSECMVNALRDRHIAQQSSTYKDFPIPLYTSPPVREPLSDDAIEDDHNLHGCDCSHIGLKSFSDGVKFAEKHHGIAK